MKAPILETTDPNIHLIEPDIERDAQLGVAWLDGQVGRKTLELMGVSDKDNKASSLDDERERVRDFIEREDQLNWMIEANKNVVGSIWVDLESTNEVPGPAIHIMIGDPDARGRGIGDTVTKAVVNYIRE